MVARPVQFGAQCRRRPSLAPHPASPGFARGAIGWAALLIGLLAFAGPCLADQGDLPACLGLSEGQTIESAALQQRPSDQLLLARLAYAEGHSTGFPDDPLVYRGIAWGVMNRVRLAEASPQMRRRFGSGVAGVIFRKGQFNPAISPRSAFSRGFLCPDDPPRWRLAEAAAAEALAGRGNPFIRTSWEKTHGVSLVVNFYYPASSQAKGPLAPWETSPGLQFIGGTAFADGVLGAERIRFYRLTRPPADVRTPAPDQPGG